MNNLPNGVYIVVFLYTENGALATLRCVFTFDSGLKRAGKGAVIESTIS